MIVTKRQCVHIYFGPEPVLPWQCALLCIEYAGFCRFGVRNSSYFLYL